jgi:hypothetical protein
LIALSVIGGSITGAVIKKNAEKEKLIIWQQQISEATRAVIYTKYTNICSQRLHIVVCVIFS